MTATHAITGATCPEWCDVDHETDGYSKHGHLIHRGKAESRTGYRIDLWFSTMTAGRERIDAPEVHIGELNQRFVDPKQLRTYAYDLLAAADQLDEIAGSWW